MRIAVNARFLLKSKMEGFGWYSYETLKRITTNHPEHEFIFFFDRKYDDQFIFSSNITPVVLNPPARHPVLFKIWFNYAVTKALKKYKADIFFSPDGFLSLRTNVKQIGVIHDLNFEHYPQDLPKSAANYLRNYFPKFAQKASAILTVSEYSKNDIVKTYNVSSEKIHVAHNGASEIFKPISLSEKIFIRDKYCQGNEYMVFVGALHPRKNLLRLIEAFEKFKLDTNSKTKLLIVGENLWRSKKLQLPHLKFKNDIVFTGHQPIHELAKIVAAAKFMTFVSYFEGFGIPIVEAMQSGCPLVCGDKTSLPEVAGNAAVYCNPFDFNSIANAITNLDSNESLLESLTQNGFIQAQKFNWNFTASKVWQVIAQELNG